MLMTTRKLFISNNNKTTIDQVQGKLETERKKMCINKNKQKKFIYVYNNIITAICAINEKMLCGKSVESERYKEHKKYEFLYLLQAICQTANK